MAGSSSTARSLAVAPHDIMEEGGWERGRGKAFFLGQLSCDACRV